MSGHTKWSDLRARKIDTPEKELAVAAARVELEQELTLYELRRAREMTQANLARALDTTQPGVSRIEHQTDLYLSTLRSYVEALGGELELRATFPDMGSIVVKVVEDIRSTLAEEADREDAALHA